MDQERPTFVHVSVDDFYFSALLDRLPNTAHEFQVSDALYAEELQLQEALMASVGAAPPSAPPLPRSTTEIGSTSGGAAAAAADDDDDMTVEEVSAGRTMTATPPPDDFCEICAENRGADEMFRSDKCCHSFCSHCISKHVPVKIGENARPTVRCERVLEAEECRGVVAAEVMEMRDQVMTESLVAAAQKFYCPFPDCSALMVDDRNDGGGVTVIRESECPVCRRLFCAACYVPWHTGVECGEFQGMKEEERGREDLMLRELAHEKKWRRCPHCKFYVEKTEGCLHITCRCKHEFCYRCGAEWTPHHGGCQAE